MNNGKLTCVEGYRLTSTGRKPKFNKPRDDLPKPTKELQAREGDLGIEKNLNKTMLVQGGTLGGRGPKGPGFYVSLSMGGWAVADRAV